MGPSWQDFVCGDFEPRHFSQKNRKNWAGHPAIFL